MTQITLRLPDGLVDALKRAAAVSGRSLNSWASSVLAAAVDPELAGDEAARVRERLRRAGLLAEPERSHAKRPPRAAVARARAAAGRGTRLSDIVSEGRR